MLKRKRVKRKLVAEINVVPYIDVTLVLLVVFMITAPLLMQGVKVELPVANSAPMDTKEQEPFIVSIKSDGSYWVDQKGDNVATSLGDVKDRVAKVLRQRPQTPVLVWGDANVDYGSVVNLMSELQLAGAPSVGLVTEPPRQ
ncbi:MAG: protein TolR [Porticoccaceae bacterium]|nr:protein TolR [Porticoccaceae bacterium]MBT3798381.1 protein TolR [Porticoccaceae bacterium]MBT4163923.1 protein TolR [Porticoccaceae bacterium]MBT4210538.1 protein TolR [Porticoccaceae bacterium]MBT4591698.1 protein TolR [Porticoccaceae bacterium]